MGVLVYAAVVVAVAVLFKIWYKASAGICTSTQRLDGKTVLVTGANTGIGLETARDLARRGARVLIACRDPERGKKALDDIVTTSGNSNVVLLRLDLSSLASVRECAAQVIKSEEKLHVLVNNAGAGGLGASQTKDGLHRGLQVNHFGPFLFTLLLVDLLKKSAPSRVVFVSSLLHKWANLTPESLDYERACQLTDVMIYNNSKLANVITANELARRLKGTGVTVNSLHPGVVKTEINRRMPKLMYKLSRLLFGLFKNPIEGAQTTIHCAASEAVEGLTGRYFSDCKEAPMATAAYNEGLAKRIWEKSESGVGLQTHENPF